MDQINIESHKKWQLFYIFNAMKVSINVVSEPICVLKCTLICALISLCSWRSQSVLLHLEPTLADTAVAPSTAASDSSLFWHSCVNWEPARLNANFGKNCNMNLFYCKDARTTPHRSTGCAWRSQWRTVSHGRDSTLEQGKIVKRKKSQRQHMVNWPQLPFPIFLCC